MPAIDLRYSLEEYYALPEGTRAELINGLIFYMSPAPLSIHQAILGEIFGEIRNYIKKHKGKCKFFTAPFDVRLSDDTVVQPDISVICDPNKLTDRGCDGSPDWVVEIVSSNASHDYFTKLNLYKMHGVREYWIVDPRKDVVTVYLFGSDEEFDLTQYKFTDTIKANIYKDNPEPLEICISDLIAPV